MNQNTNVENVLKALAVAMRTPIADPLAKAYTQPGNPTTGIAAYDLEAPAKSLYPVLTPLRNMIPRDATGYGTAVNWRSITGINTTNVSAGVEEGERGGIIQQTTTDHTAAYRGIGLENYVTFEADYAAEKFQDVKATAVMQTLEATMIAEERLDLGGNRSLALGTTPTPALAASASGGTLATLTYDVQCVALTLAGWQASSVSANGVPGQVTRNNADGTQTIYGGGSAQRSAIATQAVTGPTGSITATVTPVNGARAYAWFLGPAGAARIVAITTINSAVLTATNPTGQLASAIVNGAADNSVDATIYDGILTQVETPGSGSYVRVLPTGVAGTGTALTSGTDGSINEFDAALQWFWDNWKLSPNCIWVSSSVQRSVRKLILTGGAAAAQRFNIAVGPDGRIMGGSMALSYLNPFGMPVGGEYAQGSEIPIRVHPDLPAGTVLFTTSQLPYKLNNVPNILKKKLRRDYYQTEWPLRTRRYEYGVYFDGVLQNYYPPAFGVITNIAPS